MISLHEKSKSRNLNSAVVASLTCGRCAAVAPRRQGYVVSFETREFFLCHSCCNSLEQRVARDWLRVADLGGAR